MNDQESLDPGRLRGVIDNLGYYARLFQRQSQWVENGTMVNKNIVDLEQCGKMLIKHKGLLTKLNYNILEGAYEEVDVCTGNGFGDTGGCNNVESDALTAEEANEKGFPGTCSSPRETGDVQKILAMYNIVLNDRQTLSTTQYESCTLMLNECRKCIKVYTSQKQEIDDLIGQLEGANAKYASSIIRAIEKQIITGDRPSTTRRIGSRQKPKNIGYELQEHLLSLRGNVQSLKYETTAMIGNLNDISQRIDNVEANAEKLWSNGEPETHKYFRDGIFDNDPGRNVLCGVKADRATMKKSMLECTMTKPDEIGYELGDGEHMPGTSVTMSSVDGNPLKSHDTNIIITIPCSESSLAKNTEVVIFTRSAPKGPYYITEYHKVNYEGMPCVAISVQSLSFLVILPICRPRLCEQVVDTKGARLTVPTDETVEMNIPSGSLSRAKMVGIQTIPEPGLPIERVQQEFNELAGTSSMVYPKLPEGMKHDARIKMSLGIPDDANKTVHAMVRTNTGWKQGQYERSATQSYMVTVAQDTKQLILLQTDSSADDERAKEVAASLHQKINEYVINFLVMQHKDDPAKTYVDCCQKLVVSGRIEQAEKLGYVSSSIRTDLYLKEGAIVIVRAQGDITLFTATGDHVLQFQFSANLVRPSEVFVEPVDNASANSKLTIRGYVMFCSPLGDIGPSELKLRRKEGKADEDILLCSILVSFKNPELKANKKTNEREIFDRCVEEMATDLTRLDTIRLADHLKITNATIEHCKQEPSDYQFTKRLLVTWYQQTLCHSDKASILAEALRNIGKNQRADNMVQMKHLDVSFLDVIRLLADQEHVLKDAKLFLLSLGLSEADYTDISYRSNSLKSILTDGLLMWKSKVGLNATIDVLVGKLKEGSHNRAADLVTKLQP